MGDQEPKARPFLGESGRWFSFSGFYFPIWKMGMIVFAPYFYGPTRLYLEEVAELGCRQWAVWLQNPLVTSRTTSVFCDRLLNFRKTGLRSSSVPRKRPSGMNKLQQGPWQAPTHPQVCSDPSSPWRRPLDRRHLADLLAPSPFLLSRTCCSANRGGTRE